MCIQGVDRSPKPALEPVAERQLSEGPGAGSKEPKAGRGGTARPADGKAVLAGGRGAGHRRGGEGWGEGAPRLEEARLPLSSELVLYSWPGPTVRICPRMERTPDSQCLELVAFKPVSPCVFPLGGNARTF